MEQRYSNILIKFLENTALTQEGDPRLVMLLYYAALFTGHTGWLQNMHIN